MRLAPRAAIVVDDVIPTFAQLLWLAVTLAIAVAGLLTVRRGLAGDPARGRRRCPFCWYEFGAGTNLRCPECGKVAGSEAALAHTRVRVKLIWIGTGIAALGGGLALWPYVGEFDWRRLTPTSTLVERGRANTDAGEDARRQLAWRIRDLDGARLDDLVDAILEIQADPDAFWAGDHTVNTDWGDVLEAAWRAGSLDDEQIDRYLRGAFASTFEFEPRARVSLGAPIPYRMTTGRPRLSWRSSEVLRVHQVSRLARVLVDDVEIELDARDTGLRLARDRYAFNEEDPLIHAELAPGRHSIRVDWECGVWIPTAPRWPDLSAMDSLDELDGLRARWAVSFETTVEVVPSTVRLVPNESLRRRIVAAISCDLAYHSPPIARVPYYGGIEFINLPVHLSFDVWGRDADGREEFLGSVLKKASSENGFSTRHITNDPRALFPDARTIDVILRASRTAAERSADVDEVWEGEIEFRNVAIRTR